VTGKNIKFTSPPVPSDPQQAAQKAGRRGCTEHWVSPQCTQHIDLRCLAKLIDYANQNNFNN